MRHRVFGKKLNRSTKARKALLKSLANSVILYEKVTTTNSKAKAVKPFVEKLVTKAKEDNINSRRFLTAKLGLDNSVKKLLEVIGPTFKERPGGYLRITRLGPRSGDAAVMVVIEFVEKVSPPKNIEKKDKVKKDIVGKEKKSKEIKKTIKVKTAKKLKNEKGTNK